MEINLIGAVHYQGHSAIQAQITVVAIVINQELRIQANQVHYLLFSSLQYQVFWINVFNLFLVLMKTFV